MGAEPQNEAGAGGWIEPAPSECAEPVKGCSGRHEPAFDARQRDAVSAPHRRKSGILPDSGAGGDRGGSLTGRLRLLLCQQLQQSAPLVPIHRFQQKLTKLRYIGLANKFMHGMAPGHQGSNPVCAPLVSACLFQNRTPPGGPAFSLYARLPPWRESPKRASRSGQSAVREPTTA